MTNWTLGDISTQTLTHSELEEKARLARIANTVEMYKQKEAVFQEMEQSDIRYNYPEQVLDNPTNPKMTTATGQVAEVRVVDPQTGAEKGSKLARFDLIPSEAMWLLAEVYGAGAKKYADRNWERGYSWGLSIAALERHLNQWKRGISHDDETLCHHLACVMWHAAALLTFELKGKGTDDRSI